MGFISNLTAIIYDLRFRFVPPRCVIRWGGGPREGRGIARFRFRSAGREDDPGVNGALPRGVAATGACGPPPMNPSGPRVRFSRWNTRVRACGREEAGILFARAHLGSRFLSLRNVRRTIRGWTDVTGYERLPD